MRKFFIRGLIALLPLILTVGIIYFAINFLINYIGAPLGQLIQWILTEQRKEIFVYEQAKAFGVLLGVILTFITGLIVATFFGKQLFKFLEWLISQLPIIKTIYPFTKRLTTFFIPGEEKKLEFKGVVAIPFPHHKQYSIGFITSEGLKHLNDTLGRRSIGVFVPTAPSPFSGFVVYVPKEDIISLPITVEEAFQIIISAGVVMPPHQVLIPSEPLKEESEKRRYAENFDKQ